jgi:hypothetical protein
MAFVDPEDLPGTAMLAAETGTVHRLDRERSSNGAFGMVCGHTPDWASYTFEVAITAVCPRCFDPAVTALAAHSVRTGSYD